MQLYGHLCFVAQYAGDLLKPMDLVEKPLDWLHARSPYFSQNILTKKVLLVLREYPNSGTGPWVTIMLHKFNFLSQLFFLWRIATPRYNIVNTTTVTIGFDRKHEINYFCGTAGHAKSGYPVNTSVCWPRSQLYNPGKEQTPIAAFQIPALNFYSIVKKNNHKLASWGK